MSTIIIGNSPTALDSDMGKTIDAYDIVVRINNYETCGYEKQVGTKTDLWCRTFDTKSTNYVTRTGKEFGFMWLVFALRFHKEGEEVYKQMSKSYGSAKVAMIGEETIGKVHDEMELGPGFPHPSTGALTIGSVMTYIGDKQIDLYGFDFFKDAVVDEPTPHYFKEQPERTRGECTFVGCHIPEKERAYVQKYIDSGRLRII